MVLPKHLTVTSVAMFGVLLLLGASCKSNTEKNYASEFVSMSSPYATIQAGSTFRFLEGAGVQGNDEDTRAIEDQLQRSIIAELQSREVSLAGNLTPDLYVGLVAAETSILDAREVVRMFGIFLGEDEWDTGVPAGTILIVVLDGNTRRVLWRSSAQGAVLRDLPIAERRERVARHIDRMFATFPPVVDP